VPNPNLLYGNSNLVFIRKTLAYVLNGLWLSPPSHEGKTAINTEDELLKWRIVRIRFDCDLRVILYKKHYCVWAHSQVAETAQYQTCRGSFWCKQDETSWNSG